MEKYLSLILALMGIFLLGGYTTGELYEIKTVELDNWIITSFVTLGFLVHSIKSFKEHK